MTCTNQTDVSVYPWTCYEKITFDQSFVSKDQIFSFENCRLGKEKEGQRLWEHFINFGVGEQKPSVSNLKHKHLVTWLS